MPRVLLELDGRRIVAERLRRGMSREELAAEVEMDERTLRRIEENQGGSQYESNAQRLADALKVHIDEIVRGLDYDVGMSWIRVPHLPRGEMDAYVDAAYLDMDGDHEGAIQAIKGICGRQSGLHVVPASLLKITLAVYLDHAGRHPEAQEQLHWVLAQRSTSAGWPDVLIRAEYHLAISYRREQRWVDAEGIIERLLADENSFIRPAALHQRGAIRMGQGRWEEARADLTEAARELRGRGMYRVGYPLRRLAELAVRDGMYGEAMRLYFEAGVILAEYHCTRYVERIRKAVAELAATIDAGHHAPDDDE
ncbi:MAG: helix-turn-helix transcriptional regulator [Armatimonadetes bacterium]|nr:helix-turn-helix transcriptional regulator [Armatimonadota bacterium]